MAIYTFSEAFFAMLWVLTWLVDFLHEIGYFRYIIRKLYIRGPGIEEKET